MSFEGINNRLFRNSLVSSFIDFWGFSQIETRVFSSSSWFLGRSGFLPLATEQVRWNFLLTPQRYRYFSCSSDFRGSFCLGWYMNIPNLESAVFIVFYCGKFSHWIHMLD